MESTPRQAMAEAQTSRFHSRWSVCVEHALGVEAGMLARRGVPTFAARVPTWASRKWQSKPRAP
eukprot:15279215-Alexandrium_andersonii.AAC.1